MVFSTKKQTWAQRVAEEHPDNCEPMSDEMKESLAQWIFQTYKPAKTVWRGMTSYGEKHQFERDTGIYVTNGQFKWAMRKAGYVAHDENDINWEYYVRLKQKRDPQRKGYTG